MTDQLTRDTIDNFSKGVAEAEKLILKDQNRVRDRSIEIAAMRRQLADYDEKCREAHRNVEHLEGIRDQSARQRDLRQKELQGQDKQIRAIQQKRTEIDEEAASSRQDAQTFQNEYTDAALEAQELLLEKLVSADPHLLEKQHQQLKSEVEAARKRVALLEGGPSRSTANTQDASQKVSPDELERKAKLEQLTQLTSTLSDLEAKRSQVQACCEDEIKSALAALENRRAEYSALTKSLEEHETKLPALQAQHNQLVEALAMATCNRCGQTLTALPSNEESHLHNTTHGDQQQHQQDSNPNQHDEQEEDFTSASLQFNVDDAPAE